jgi:2-polyprenyl-3-methyl-5-hydroxy-6-metoxy-1,4-benzoquinol methylase
MSQYRKPWLYRCPGCGFLQSTLSPEIRDAAARAVVDEPLRARALNGLRLANFKLVTDRLSAAVDGHGRQLLDVGCAHGWFLDAAAARGFDVVGLEPDPAIAALAASGGRRVWEGFFPDDVPPDASFDVITFNDVFEHLPDIDAAIAACHRLLRPGGILVLNVPSSAGIFYRAAAALDRVGISGPFERMWQTRFSSPHLSYFAPDQLKRFVEQSGFTEIDRSSLPSIRLAGLWARLGYDRTASRLIKPFIWLGVAAIRPLVGLLPADITVQMFRRDA